MKTIFNVAVFTLMFVLSIGALSVHAQMREVVIENTGLLECIQDAIMEDLAANGEDVVNNTKYILRRGETYVHSTQYQPSHKVWLEAEEGDGPLPRILGVNTGGEAPRMVRSTDDMTFIGLRYEGLDSDGNHTDNAPCRQRGDGTTMTAKNCIFSNHRLEVFRADGGNQKWYVENNLVLQNYQKDLWDKGYTFSFHDDKIDTFVIKNNTFYNSTATLMHSDLTAGANYVEFSQNTLHNIGGTMQGYVYQGAYEAALINFGVAQNVVCRDNLIIDCMTFGYPPQWADSIYVINVNLTDSTGTIDVRNNNIWRDPEFASINPDTLEMITWLDPELTELIGEKGEDYGFISEAVTFNDVPDVAPMKDAVEAYFSSPDAMFDPDAISIDETPDPEEVDFGYTAKKSPTASTAGGPLGAARWHDGVTVGVEDNADQVVNSFTLHGNYPNPFNPTTTIRFGLPVQADVQITYTNALGQVVYETPLKSYSAGMNKKVTVNASDWASGVYFYQVSADMPNAKMVKTGKMMLLK